jgi:hypothetical protein
MSHPFVMMRVMTAIVIDLPTARRRRKTGPPPRRAGTGPARLIDLASYRRARSARRGPRRDVPEYDDDDEEDDDGWAERAHRVVDAAEELLAAGRAAEVVEFCGLAARCLDRNAAELGNPCALLGLTERLGDLRARAGGHG